MHARRSRLGFLALACATTAALAAEVPTDNGVMRFDLATGWHSPGEKWTSVAADLAYTDDRGFGYEHGPRLAGQPYRFSVRVPDGNYRVTVQLGDAKAASTTTVKSEQRRLMLEQVVVPAGQLVTRSFTMNVRTPQIFGAERPVRLNDREKDTPNWDDKLMLEILGENPALASVEIERVENATTIFLAGDSTVTDQRDEPWAGWGQLFPRFVRHDIAVANYAESGRTLTSFRGDRRLEKILSVAKAGDYLFIQFGHNDMKDKGENAGAYGNYTANLREYIAAARAKGMTPVVLTPMHRRRFNSAGQIENTFGDYPEAARKVATEEKVAFIDLSTMSKTLYEALGDEPSKAAFVHFPANSFPGQTEALKDNTHHSTYGGYELAKCVVEAMRTMPELNGLLAEDVQPFDPAKPDAVEAFAVPKSLSTTQATIKPAGS